MVRGTIFSVRQAMQTAQSAYYEAQATYMAALLRNADGDERERLLVPCRHAADTFERALLQLTACLDAEPHTRERHAEHQQLGRLQRALHRELNELLQRP